MGYKKRLLCLFGMLLPAIASFSQTWEIGVIGGGSAYMGDLNPKNPLKFSGISAGAYGKYNLDPYWGIGLHYTYGRIKADDAHSDNQQFRDRNLKFYTPLNEITLQLDFNFLDYFAGGGRKNFSPYVYTGIGGVFFTPKTEYNDDEFKLAFVRTEGQEESYRRYAMTIPYGVGLRIRLKENWSLFSQVGYRTAFTDYLDDVGGKYPDPSVWDANDPSFAVRKALSDRSGENTGVYLGVPGTQRGDFRKRDTYMFAGIGISFTFVSQKCYTF